MTVEESVQCLTVDALPALDLVQMGVVVGGQPREGERFPASSSRNMGTLQT